MMIRRLIEAFTRELRMLCLGHALLLTDDAAFARNTAMAEIVRRRLMTVPADCPLPDCTTCQPSAPPLDVVAEEQRAGETNYAAWWLITTYPEAWYFAKPETVQQVAARLVRLRTAVKAGRVLR